MSMRTLAIWIIIAGLLGGASLVLRDRQSGSHSNQEIEWVGLGFDPASITELRIERERDLLSLHRDEVSIDRWVGRWSSEDSQEEWAISPTRVRGALRALATARVRLGEGLDEDGLMNKESGVIVITSRSGSATSIQLGDDRSGGRTPVRVEQRDETGAIERLSEGWLDSSVPDALTPELVRSWREQRMMHIAPSSITRVRLGAGPNSVTLARREGRWWIAEPFEMHADQQSVESLVQSLLAIKAERFVDDEVDDSVSGLSQPLATIEIGDQDSLNTLTIGTRADVNGDTLYARFEHGQSAALIQVSTEALSKLTAVPDAYISKLAASFASTDVRSVSVLGLDSRERMRATRNAEHWMIDGSNADTLTGESIDRIVSILLRQPAPAVRMLKEDEEFPKAIAGVALYDAQGQVLGTYEIAFEQGTEGLRLLVMNRLSDARRVVWAYVGDDAQAAGTWLTIAASRRVSTD